MIESTGISEPVPVAQTFSFVSEESGIDLSRFAYVDTMVTVVDAANFLNDFSSADDLQTRDLSDDPADRRPIVNLLTDQVEFANVIIINKMDQVSAFELDALEGLLKRLNPEARFIRTTFGNVHVGAMVGTGLFDLEVAETSAGWIKELEGIHVPESETYGFGSFVFRSSIPFHPLRFHKFLSDDFPGHVYRSKGFFWLASRPDEAMLWSQAGGSLRYEVVGSWWASKAPYERICNPDFLANREKIESQWHPIFGDRKQELVFIGQAFDEAGVRKQLERCLLRDWEIDAWREGEAFADPFTD